MNLENRVKRLEEELEELDERERALQKEIVALQTLFGVFKEEWEKSVAESSKLKYLLIGVLTSLVTLLIRRLLRGA